MAGMFNANPTYDEAVRLLQRARDLKAETIRALSDVERIPALNLPGGNHNALVIQTHKALVIQFRKNIVAYLQTLNRIIKETEQNRDAANANHPVPRVFNKNLALELRRLDQQGRNTSHIADQMKQLLQDQARYEELRGLLHGRPQESKQALLAERAAIMRTISGTGSTRQGMQVRPQQDYAQRMAYINEALKQYKLIEEFERLHQKLFLPQAGAAAGVGSTNVNKPITLKF